MRVPDHIVHLIGQAGYDWMAEQAAKMESVVEVGCWHGAGTWTLCMACPGAVYAVDHFQGSPAVSDATYNPSYDVYEKFMANVKQFVHLTVLKMPSVDAAKLFQPKSIDMIFIDAGHDHTSFAQDWEAWRPICKKLICGHDWGHLGVQEKLKAMHIPVTHHVADIWSARCDD